jgi:hypothetical protein
MLCNVTFSIDKYRRGYILIASIMVPGHNGKSDLALSELAKDAFGDLESLGYDVAALMRMNMNDDRIVELRDRAYRYRGIKPRKAEAKKDPDDLTKFFGMGVDLAIRQDSEAARDMARHILYLAERELSES